MSARQRARIARHSAQLDFIAGADEHDPDGSNSDEYIPASTKPRFHYSDSSDSDEQSTLSVISNAGEELNVIPEPVVIGSQHNAATLAVTDTRGIIDDHDFLDKAIEEQRGLRGAAQDRYPDNMGLLFCNDDIKHFDLRSEMRRREGADGAGLHGPDAAGVHRGRGPPNLQNPGGPNRGLRAATGRGNKRYLFGAPSEDWARPPSFAAGGLGMVRLPAADDSSAGKLAQLKSNKRRGSVATASSASRNSSLCFAFTMSEDYAFLCAQYQYIRSTGDANLLVMFLAHFPHFHRGLLQLGMIYARLPGQLSKAVDLLGRALHVFDCAALEAFKPTMGGGAGGGEGTTRCLLDTTRHDASADYLAALQLYIRLASALGCHRVAATCCRYLASLTRSDEGQALVVLDSLLLAAGDHGMLRRFCGLPAVGDSTVGLSDSVLELVQFCFRSPLRLYNCALGEGERVDEADSTRVLEHLPNWWFSLALSSFIQQKPLSNAQSSGSSEECTRLLKAALLHWPFVLSLLLRHCGENVAAAGPWGKVLQHPLFEHANTRVSASSHLGVLGTLYAQRGAPLWRQVDGALGWLRHTAAELVMQVEAGGSALLAEVLSVQKSQLSALEVACAENDVLHQYATAQEETFSPTFAPFPGNQSPLDPSLDDPEYLLSGAIRFRDFINEEGEFMFAVPSPYASTLRRKRERRRRRHVGRRRGAGDSEGEEGSASSDSRGESDEGEGEGEGWVEQLLRLGGEGGGGSEVEGGRDGAGAGGRGNLRMGGRPGALFADRWGGGGDGNGAMQGQGRHPRQQSAQQSNIDFSLPLLQLLLATLLPWIFVQPLLPRHRR